MAGTTITGRNITGTIRSTDMRQSANNDKRIISFGIEREIASFGGSDTLFSFSRKVAA